MNEQERKRRLDPPLCSFLRLSSHPPFLSPSLPLFSNVCSVHWQSVWIDGYHIHTYSYIILRTRCYIFSHSVTLCVLVSLIGSGGGQWCLQRRWHCWYSLCGDKEKFYLRWYRHWSYLGSGVFINHRMDCIACIPTDHISAHMIVFMYNTDQFTYHIYPCLFDTHYTHRCYFLFCMPSQHWVCLNVHKKITFILSNLISPPGFPVMTWCRNRKQKRCIKQMHHA